MTICQLEMVYYNVEMLRVFFFERFQKCLEGEGLDTLAYVQMCINRGPKEILGEK